jgi:triosephosphate isomerase (TIM)
LTTYTRRPLIVGNWKMHKTLAQTRELLQALRTQALPAAVDVVVCPPFTALAAASEELRGSRIALGAQTMHEEEQGAFTGEVSPIMLRELSVSHVILGHSERRRFCGETDESIARKVRAALAHDITPIVAVGETAEEHERGLAIELAVSRTRAAFTELTQKEVARCVVAYEPIWAIGTGLVDEPTETNVVMGAIRSCLPGLQNASILYGGSMKADNAAALVKQSNIDGGLIGGASLTAQAFLAVIEIL